MSSKPFDVIATRGTTEAAVLKAFREIGAGGEPAEFWTAIAVDPTYEEWRRAYCLLMLFRRHLKVGMTLAEMARALRVVDWLDDKDVAVATEITGEMPIRWEPEDTAVVITLSRDPAREPIAVYLRVEGRVDRDALLGWLRGQGKDERSERPVIREIGFSQPAELAEW